MTQQPVSSENNAPVWASPDTFPYKPDSGAFGFQDTKRDFHQAENLAELVQLIEKSKHGIELVWSPESPFLVVPEEILGLRPCLDKRRTHWAKNDISDGQRTSLVIGVAFLWALYSAFVNHRGNWSAVAESPTVAIAAILLLILGLIPWYEGWKVLNKRKKRPVDYWDQEIVEARFDCWLAHERAPFTLALLGLILTTGIAQWFLSGSVNWMDPSVERVGLLKATSGAVGGENWRYLTAPLVHGHLVHWLLNAAALRYLARRVEVLARWPHLLIAFLFSMITGGITTAVLQPTIPSVGASGGILGLLGFLLVFETLRKPLVPRPARKRMLAGLLMVAIMGLLGFSFIDNSAHLGGLLGGMAYAAMVFPPSASFKRPVVLMRDKVVAASVVAVLLYSLVLCLLKLAV